MHGFPCCSGVIAAPELCLEVNFLCSLDRAEQERLKHKARQAEDLVTGLRRQLDDRSREVEQLTTLSLKGDATLQEYMAQLTVS